jgi:hypothetical protein
VAAPGRPRQIASLWPLNKIAPGVENARASIAAFEKATSYWE